MSRSRLTTGALLVVLLLGGGRLTAPARGHSEPSSLGGPSISNHTAYLSSAGTGESHDREIYVEDFEDAAAESWTLTGGAAVRTLDGDKVLAMPRASDAGLRFGTYWSEYSFTARVRLLSGNLQLGYRRLHDSSGEHGYFIGFSRHELSLVKMRNSSLRTLASKPTDHQLRRWYTVKIAERGSVVTAWVDGERRLRVRDRKPLATGSVSVHSAGRSRVDDIKVNATLPFSATWSPTNGPQGLSQMTTIVSSPSDSGTIYAGSFHNGLLKSVDAGRTWTQITDRDGLAQTKVLDIGIAPSKPRVIYVTHQEQRGASKSTDGGNHWVDLDFHGNWGNLHAVAVDPRDPSTVYVGAGTHQSTFASDGDGIYKSTNGGKRWRRLSIGTIQVFDLLIPRSQPDVLYAGTARGVFKSEDGGDTWVTANDGIAVPGVTDAQVTQLLTDPSVPDVLYARTQDPGPLFKSDDAGDSWHQVNASVHTVALSESSPGTLYIAKGPEPDPAGGVIDYGFAVWRSSNGGQTWTEMGTFPSVGRRITAMAVDRTDPEHLWLGGWEMLLVSHDGGATANPPETHFSGAATFAIAVAPQDAQIVYAGHGDGHLSVTHDGGTSWQRLADVGSGGPDGAIVALAVHPVDPNLVFAGSLEGVFKSRDGGNTFMRVTNGLADTRVISVAPDPSDVDRLFVGTGSHKPYQVYEGSGLFRSTDGGESWSKGSGLPDAPVPTIVVDPGNPRRVYAAVMGEGIYKSADSGVTWNPANDGIQNRYMYTLAIDPTDPSTLYAGTLAYYGDPDYKLPAPYTGAGVYKTSNGGASWRLVHEAEMIENVAVDPSAPKNVYAADHAERIWHSSNGGKTWRLANQGLVMESAHLYMFGLAMSSDGSVLYMSNCGRGVYRNFLHERESR